MDDERAGGRGTAPAGEDVHAVGEGGVQPAEITPEGVKAVEAVEGPVVLEVAQEARDGSVLVHRAFRNVGRGNDKATQIEPAIQSGDSREEDQERDQAVRGGQRPPEVEERHEDEVEGEG